MYISRWRIKQRCFGLCIHPCSRSNRRSEATDRDRYTDVSIRVDRHPHFTLSPSTAAAAGHHRNGSAAAALTAFGQVAAVSSASASTTDGTKAVYLQAPTNIPVSSTTGNVTVLSHAITLASSQPVLLSSDGVLTPGSSTTTANVWIAVDGTPVTTVATILWADHQTHGYNVIGAPTIAAGDHTVSLVAAYVDGPYSVLSTSNLSVLVQPATNVTEDTQASTSSNFNFNTLQPLRRQQHQHRCGQIEHQCNSAHVTDQSQRELWVRPGRGARRRKRTTHQRER